MCLSHKSDPAVYEGADFQPNVPGSSTNVAGEPIQSTQSYQPTTMGRIVQVATGGAYDPTGGKDLGAYPTKFGMLMRVLGPALQGGLIGLAGGQGHPGGGFGAAQDFHDRQRAYQMQAMLLQRQFQNDAYRNALEAARTHHELNRPLFTGRGSEPVKARDAQGNLVYVRPNPYTGEPEALNGYSPDINADYTSSNTDQGIVLYDKHGTAPTKPLTLPDNSNAPAQIPTGPPIGSIQPSEFDSGSPRIPLTPGTGTASQSPSGIQASAGTRIPLRPSGFNTPKVVIRASRNAAGIETDSMYDENPNSATFGKLVGALGNTRQPLPDRAGNRESTRDAQRAADIARSEQYAAAALAKNGGDPDKAIQSLNGLKFTDPKVVKDFNRLLPQIRKSITDRARKRVKNTNPFGMADKDWQALIGGSIQQNQDEDEQ